MFDKTKKTISEENHNNKKGFQIIVKNLDNGEEVVNCQTRAIIGAYQTKSPEGGNRRKRNDNNILQHGNAYGNHRGGGRYRNRGEKESHRRPSSRSASYRFAFGR